MVSAYLRRCFESLHIPIDQMFTSASANAIPTLSDVSKLSRAINLALEDVMLSFTARSGT